MALLYYFKGEKMNRYKKVRKAKPVTTKKSLVNIWVSRSVDYKGQKG